MPAKKTIELEGYPDGDDDGRFLSVDLHTFGQITGRYPQRDANGRCHDAGYVHTGLFRIYLDDLIPCDRNVKLKVTVTIEEAAGG